MGGGFGRVYLVCEQIVEPDQMPPQRVFVFEDYTPFPADSPASTEQQTNAETANP